VPESFGFSANDAARISAAVRAVESGRLNQRSDLELEPKDRNYTKIAFRNDNSGTVPAYGLMRVTGMATVEGKTIFTIDQPNTTFSRIYLVNGPTEVLTGKRSWGTWLWHADYVLYTAATPAYGETWGPTNATWTITQHRPGFYIMGGNTGTGSASRTIAMQSIPEQVFGKADAAIANAASGTVRVYGGTPGSEADTGLTIASCYNYGADIADEANVSVGWLHGKPYVQNMSCP
jgi:hypothetical protein